MADKSLKTVKTRILCTKSERKQTTESGIFLGSSSGGEADQYATVTFVGPEVKADIVVGDEIVPMWNTCAVVTHNGEKHFVVDESNIVAILK